jgi:hypothetical protein
MDDTAGNADLWGGRRASDAAPVRLDTLYAALKHSGPYDPQPVPFETHGHLLLDEAPGCTCRM